LAPQFQRASHQIADLTTTIWNMRAEMAAKDAQIAQAAAENLQLRREIETLQKKQLALDSTVNELKRSMVTAPSESSKFVVWVNIPLLMCFASLWSS
jgi:cell division protein FtsB